MLRCGIGRRWPLVDNAVRCPAYAGLQVAYSAAPDMVNFAEIRVSGGSLCVRGRYLGHRLITFNRQGYVVADLKRVLSWITKLLSNYDSNMRFRTVENDENFKVQLRKMDVE